MGRPRKLTGDALAEFYRLADAGLSLRELADRYKFTERTAINYLERRMPPASEQVTGAVSVGTEGPQGTPDAEGRGNKEVA
jgi:hypothetical protein